MLRLLHLITSKIENIYGNSDVMTLSSLIYNVLSFGLETICDEERAVNKYAANLKKYPVQLELFQAHLFVNLLTIATFLQ